MTKKTMINLLYWIAFIAIALYFAYMKGWIFTNFESITPKQAQVLLEKDPSLTLLDVRTPEEYAEEHIEGSILIPVQVLPDNLSKLENAKNSKIIVYCRSGARSVSASRILSDNGFSPLNVTGGITQWKSDGLSLKR